jgi:hypothetical protein
VNSLTVTPDGGSIVAATYGRGLWKIEVGEAQTAKAS